MFHRIAGRVLPLAALLLVAPSRGDDLAQVQKEIERARRELDAERQMHLSDLARRQAWESSSKQRLQEMRRETSRALRESDSLADVLASLEAQSRSRQGEKGRAERIRQAAASALAIEVDSASVRLSRELPDAAEARGRDFGDLARGLRAGLIAPPDGVKRLSNLMVGLCDAGGRVETVRGTNTLPDGRLLQGHYVRAGGLFEAFVSDDSATARVRRPARSGGWEWNDNLTGFQKSELLRLVRIQTAGEKPGFVALPLGLALGVADGGDGK